MNGNEAPVESLEVERQCAPGPLRSRRSGDAASVMMKGTSMPTRIVVYLGMTVALFAAPVVAQWMKPTLLANVNSTARDGLPSLSQDGRTIYFASERLGGPANVDIYRASRNSPYGTFGVPTNATDLNSPKDELGTSLRGDGLEIFFTSGRNGVRGDHIWRATRSSPTALFSPAVPVNELIGPTPSQVNYSPSITADGLLLYFWSARPGGQGGNDIWMATRPSVSAPFGQPRNVTELNRAGPDQDPRISADGLRIFWQSDRAGGVGREDIWTASRLSRSQPFTNFVNLVAVNSTEMDGAPGCSAMGDELVFHSTRPGSASGHAIWSTRFIGVTSNGVAGPGKTQTLNFSDPTSPGLAYLAAASFGNKPGIPVGGRTIPLNPDPLFALTVGGLPPYLNGYAGMLDSNGVSRGSITTPNVPALIGLRFFNAFVVPDPNSPHGIKTISNAHEVLVQ